VPLLDLIDRLPLPQRDALATVFGLSAGAVPDRFLVGLATLTLHAEAAEQQSLLCIIDDAQWLDDASAQILVYDATRSAVWLSAYAAQPARHWRQCTSAMGSRAISVVTQSTNRRPLTCSV
jgi:hypothetical protein